MAIHSGSWFGLPDFGITEAIGNTLGIPTNYQGGSNITGSYPQSPTYQQNIQQAQQLAAVRQNPVVPAYKPATNNVPQQIVQQPQQPQQSSGPSPEQMALDQARNSLNSAYDPLYQQLDQMAGYIPQWQQQKEQGVIDMYGNQQSQLQTAQQGANKNIDLYRGQVAQNQAKSTRELQQNMQKMLQAGNVYLGTAGAGDSSAANMYGFALSKAAGQAGAQISDAASSQYNDLNLKQSDVETTYNTNMSQLAQWRDTELGKVRDWATSSLQNIQQQKVNATGQKAAALAQNQTNIINQTLSYLQNLDSQATQWASTMQNWAITRMAQLDDQSAKMGQQSQYNVQDIIAPQLAGITSPVGQQQSSDFYSSNPFSQAYQKKKDQFNQFGY